MKLKKYNKKWFNKHFYTVFRNVIQFQCTVNFESYKEMPLLLIRNTYTSTSVHGNTRILESMRKLRAIKIGHIFFIWSTTITRVVCWKRRANQISNSTLREKVNYYECFLSWPSHGRSSQDAYNLNRVVISHYYGVLWRVIGGPL